MSKICTFCGTEADDNALFCGECGKKLEQPVQYAQPVQQPSQPVRQQTPPQQNYYQPYGQNMYGQPQPVQYAAQPVPKKKKPGKGFGIASLILGIIAIVNSGILMLITWSTGTLDTQNNTDDRYVASGISIAVIFFICLVALLALLSLIFGIISLVKGNKGTAIAGLIMSALSIAACVFSFVVVSNLDKASISDLINKGSGYSEFDFDSDIDEFSKYFIE